MLDSPLRFCHTLLSLNVQSGDIVVDATVGNGYDTVKLAQLVGETGKVYGFDIQEEALQETKKKLTLTGMIDQVDLYQIGHEKMEAVLPQEINLSTVVFNLGYLPKGDRSIITKAETTLEAIKQSLKLLRKGGLLFLMIYYGHDGGKNEKDAVISFLEKLAQNEFDVLQYGFINQKNSPPFLIVVEKK